jgi:hypothetical protein
MTGSSLFDHLARHTRIVVTGPQRSGTRITAQMIAADTGHTFVDEMSFEVSNEALWRLILKEEQVVVQAPGLLKVIVDRPPSGIFVVLMRRDLGRIHASEDRIGWETVLHGNSGELAQFGLKEGQSADIKYEYWDTHDKCFDFVELPGDIAAHPLYLPDHRRIGFGPLQTS